MRKKTSNLYSNEIKFIDRIYSYIYKISVQRLKLHRYKNKKQRFLELGPGNTRIPHFETVNLVKNNVTDFVGDILKNLPFDDNSFDVLYASHILEHAPWYMLDEILKEWHRILKPGGVIEIWVPNGLKIAKAFVETETEESIE